MVISTIGGVTMNNAVHYLLTNKDYRFGKHKVEAGEYRSTYTYDGFVMIEFYHTLKILVFHKPIIKKEVITIFEKCGLKIKYDKNHKVYEIRTVFGYVLGGSHIKYTMSDWSIDFVAVKILLTNTLFFRGKDLVYTLLNDKLGTETDRQPRP